MGNDDNSNARGPIKNGKKFPSQNHKKEKQKTSVNSNKEQRLLRRDSATEKKQSGMKETSNSSPYRQRRRSHLASLKEKNSNSSIGLRDSSKFVLGKSDQTTSFRTLTTVRSTSSGKCLASGNNNPSPCNSSREEWGKTKNVLMVIAAKRASSSICGRFRNDDRVDKKSLSSGAHTLRDGNVFVTSSNGNAPGKRRGDHQQMRTESNDTDFQQKKKHRNGSNRRKKKRLTSAMMEAKDGNNNKKNRNKETSAAAAAAAVATGALLSSSSPSSKKEYRGNGEKKKVKKAPKILNNEKSGSINNNTIPPFRSDEGKQGKDAIAEVTKNNSNSNSQRKKRNSWRQVITKTRRRITEKRITTPLTQTISLLSSPWQFFSSDADSDGEGNCHQQGDREEENEHHNNYEVVFNNNKNRNRTRKRRVEENIVKIIATNGFRALTLILALLVIGIASFVAIYPSSVSYVLAGEDKGGFFFDGCLGEAGGCKNTSTGTSTLQNQGKEDGSSTINPTSSSPSPPTTTPYPTFSNPTKSVVDALKPVLLSPSFLHDKQSPQSRALHWIVHEDSVKRSHSDRRLIQRYVLAVLYFSWGGENWMDSMRGTADGNSTDNLMEDGITSIKKHKAGFVPLSSSSLSLSSKELVTDGEGNQEVDEVQAGEEGNNKKKQLRRRRQQQESAPWLSAVDECEWSGVVCNIFDWVREINLYSNNLSGDIPREIGALEWLVHLELGSNNITGSIPIEIGNLFRLEHLKLYNNDMTGVIPQSIEKLKSVKKIWLFMNKLTGSIPPGVGQLTQLVFLDLSRNFLQGEIPGTIGNLWQLQYLGLDRNQLEGTVPYSVENLAQLKWFFLQKNELSGNIPQGICRLDRLSLVTLYADCGGSSPEVSCTCCTLCH